MVCRWLSRMVDTRDYLDECDIYNLIASNDGIEVVVTVMEQDNDSEQIQRTACRFLVRILPHLENHRVIDAFGGGFGPIFAIYQWIEDNQPNHQITDSPIVGSEL